VLRRPGGNKRNVMEKQSFVDNLRNSKMEKYKPGDLVYLKRSIIEGPKQLLTVLWEIDPDEDEADDKYLVRTSTHSKMTVFHCEIIPAEENGKGVLESNPKI
jgi:hypothetical protein